MVAMIDLVRAGTPGEGMAEAVRQIGIVLTEHFPKTDQNPNELPDRLIEL
jgi:putative membrane protein